MSNYIYFVRWSFDGDDEDSKERTKVFTDINAAIKAKKDIIQSEKDAYEDYDDWERMDITVTRLIIGDSLEEEEFLKELAETVEVHRKVEFVTRPTYD